MPKSVPEQMRDQARLLAKEDAENKATALEAERLEREGQRLAREAEKVDGGAVGRALNPKPIER